LMAIFFVRNKSEITPPNKAKAVVFVIFNLSTDTIDALYIESRKSSVAKRAIGDAAPRITPKDFRNHAFFKTRPNTEVLKGGDIQIRQLRPWSVLMQLSVAIPPDKAMDLIDVHGVLILTEPIHEFSERQLTFTDDSIIRLHVLHDEKRVRR